MADVTMQAQERIGRAQLQVQPTQVVPGAEQVPSPVPEPATVPEPYPPQDEGDRPQRADDPRGRAPVAPATRVRACPQETLECSNFSGRQGRLSLSRTRFLMARRLVLGLLLSLIVALPAALSTQARAGDSLSTLQAKIAAAQAKETQLSSDIGSIEGRIRTLEKQVGGVSAHLSTLEHDLALQQAQARQDPKGLPPPDRSARLPQAPVHRFRLAG